MQSFWRTSASTLEGWLALRVFFPGNFPRKMSQTYSSVGKIEWPLPGTFIILSLCILHLISLVSDFPSFLPGIFCHAAGSIPCHTRDPSLLWLPASEKPDRIRDLAWLVPGQLIALWKFDSTRFPRFWWTIMKERWRVGDGVELLRLSPSLSPGILRGTDAFLETEPSSSDSSILMVFSYLGMCILRNELILWEDIYCDFINSGVWVCSCTEYTSSRTCSLSIHDHGPFLVISVSSIGQSLFLASRWLIAVMSLQGDQPTKGKPLEGQQLFSHLFIIYRLLMVLSFDF